MTNNTTNNYEYNYTVTNNYSLINTGDVNVLNNFTLIDGDVTLIDGDVLSNVLNNTLNNNTVLSHLVDGSLVENVLNNNDILSNNEIIKDVLTGDITSSLLSARR